MYQVPPGHRHPLSPQLGMYD